MLGNDEKAAPSASALRRRGQVRELCVRVRLRRPRHLFFPAGVFQPAEVSKIFFCLSGRKNGCDVYEKWKCMVVMVGLAAFVGMCTMANAAVIDIASSSGTLTDSASEVINTGGTLVDAVNGGGQAAATINGITFDEVNASTTTLANLNNGSSGWSSYTTLDPILDQGYYGPQNWQEPIMGYASITFTGLEANTRYVFQCFSDLSAHGGQSRVFDVDLNGDAASTLLLGPLGNQGVKAVFYFSTVDTADVAFTFHVQQESGDTGAIVNAFSLQKVGAVPEPGTVGLLAIGLVGLLAYAWRKRK